jgi:hypothetical protein
MPTKRRSQRNSLITAAIGVRVKSGWGSAIVLGGSSLAPRLLYRCQVELSDPTSPRSRQPYHRGFGALQNDPAILRPLIRAVHRATDRSMAALLRHCRQQGYALRSLALVVGSTIAPEVITNEHIRAHAYEGRLFRMALERAARHRGLRCRVVRERDLAATAVTELGQSGGVITRVVRGLGHVAGRPGRGEEKAAATAAWLGLRRRNVARSGLTRA